MASSMSWLIATRRSLPALRDELSPGDDVIRYTLEFEASSAPTLYCARLDAATSLVVNRDRTYPMVRLHGAGGDVPPLFPPGEPIPRTRTAFGIEEEDDPEQLRELADLLVRRELGTRFVRVSVQGPRAPDVVRHLCDGGIVRATSIALTAHLPDVRWEHNSGRCELPAPGRQPMGTVAVAWAPVLEPGRRSAYLDRAMADRDALAAQLSGSALRTAGLIVHVFASWVLRGDDEPIELGGAHGVEPLPPGAYVVLVVDDHHRWIEVGRGVDLSPSQIPRIVEAASSGHSRFALRDEPLVRLGFGPVATPAEAPMPAPASAERRSDGERAGEPPVAVRLAARLEVAERALRSARRESAAMARELERLSEIAMTPVVEEVLAEDHVPEAAGLWSPVDEPEDLSTPRAALDAAADLLSHVVVTEHARDVARTLDSHGKAAVWGRRCWRVLADLDRYAATRVSHDGIANFRAFLSQVDDPSVTATQVAIRESETVLASTRMRAERVRPVPVDVDPSGRALFVEHVRIESGGRGAAPRLYFFDDTSGRTGKVVVGYVGPHLTNAST